MSVDPGALPPPPQLSPDGKYVWDGAQWQPIAAPDDQVHVGVFKAWNSVAVEPGAPGAEAAEPAAVVIPVPVPVPVPAQVEPEYPVPEYPAPAYPAPAPQVDYSYAADEPIVPLWQQPAKSPVTKYLYFGAALVIFAMVLMLLNTINFINLPFISAGSPAASPVAVKASPTPDFSGSDATRAQRFLTTFKPALAGVEHTVQPVYDDCVGVPSTSCFNSLTASADQIKKAVAVADNGDIAPCIVPAMTKEKADLQGMDQQLKVALQGFQDNNSDELATGVYRFKTYYKFMEADQTVLNQAQKKCLTLVVPSWVPR